MVINLYPHQKKAYLEMRNGCVLCGGVGSGKSITAVTYFFTKVAKAGICLNGKGELSAMENPTDLYIITTAKKRDNLEWEGELARFGLSTHQESCFGYIRVVIDSWNNIGKYAEVEDAFFIFDEQRLVGSGAWVKYFLKIAKTNKWILLSATPGDSWMDYIPIFIANGFYKNRTEFIRKHVIFKRFVKYPVVDGYIGERHLEELRKSILVDMPYRKTTVRHKPIVHVEYDKFLYDKVMKNRWNVFEERPCRDVAEVFRTLRRIVYSDPSRLEAVKEILDKHDKIIIFYSFDYELDILRSLSEMVEVAEWNGHKHQPIPKADRWVYLVNYTSGNEGWNCVDTNVIVKYSQQYSYRVDEQTEGRIDRINTPFKDLYYYILRSGASVETLINKALSTKKDFNERYFLVKNGENWTISLED